MPLIGLAALLLDVTCMMHAHQRGKPMYWYFVIGVIPFLGALVYFVMEWLPELAHTRRGQQIHSNIVDVIAPDREWNRRREHVLLTGSIDAKRGLAEECERKGMWTDAMALYDNCAQGPFADDPVLLMGLARAQLGGGVPVDALRTLDRLQAANPGFESQEGHLLYARALEDAGRTGEALAEYRTLIGYYTGLEARTRLGLLLLKQGQPQEARQLFADVVRAAKVRGAVLTIADNDWLKVSRANMS